MLYEVTRANKYKHYKGGIYDHIGETVNTKEITEEADHVFVAAYSEAPSNLIKVYQFSYKNGFKYYVPYYPPLTLYKDNKGVVWARPAIMFHGFLDDGNKRFTLIEEN